MRLSDGHKIDTSEPNDSLISHGSNLDLDQSAVIDHLNQATTLFQIISEAAFIMSNDGYILNINHAFSDLFGYKKEDLADLKPLPCLPEANNADFYEALREGAENGGTWRGKIWLRKKSGELYPSFLTLKAVLNRSGEATSLVGVLTSTSSTTPPKYHFEHLAYRDPLTKLLDQYIFIDYCDQVLKGSSRKNKKSAVLLIHIQSKDNKLEEDLRDILRFSVAQRIRSHFGQSTTIAYMYDDVFAVFVEDASSEQYIESEVSKLIEVLTLPYQPENREIPTSCKIGISIYPDDGLNADDLVDRAITALTHADLADDDASHKFFNTIISRDNHARIDLEKQLCKSIEDNTGLHLHYQPQVDLKSGELTGVETLVRWSHPRLGTISPERLIFVAERCGLIEELSNWILREACRQMASWQENNLPIKKIAINLSKRHFSVTNLVEQIEGHLQDFGLSPAALEFELTEAAIVSDREHMTTTLSRLRELGSSIAIDDFGTGYTALHHLFSFPADTLKIDLRFTSGLPEHRANSILVSTMISLAHSFGLNVLAEGIETEQQKNYLEELNCDHGQGFLFGHPMSDEDLIEWVQKQNLTNATK